MAMKDDKFLDAFPRARKAAKHALKGFSDAVKVVAKEKQDDAFKVGRRVRILSDYECPADETFLITEEHQAAIGTIGVLMQIIEIVEIQHRKPYGVLVQHTNASLWWPADACVLQKMTEQEKAMDKKVDNTVHNTLELLKKENEILKTKLEYANEKNFKNSLQWTEKALEKSRKTKKKLHAENKQLRDDNKKLDETFKEMEQATKESYEHHIKNLRIKANDLNNMIAQKECAVEGLKGANKGIEKTAIRFEKETIELKGTLNTRNLEIQKLQNELTYTGAAYDRFTMFCENKQKVIDSLRKENQKLEPEIEKLKKQMEQDKATYKENMDGLKQAMTILGHDEDDIYHAVRCVREREEIERLKKQMITNNKVADMRTKELVDVTNQLVSLQNQTREKHAKIKLILGNK